MGLIEVFANIGLLLTVMSVYFFLFLIVRYEDMYYGPMFAKCAICCIISVIAHIAAKGELLAVIKYVAIIAPAIVSTAEMVTTVKSLIFEHSKRRKNKC